ncbi:MAG TPA: hypothetical protein PK637_13255 [Flavobacteriales bacterium]|nr:hypothetical protein [Flavobacteriales bacterium]HRE97730.1 hypothetical protein [Flavobacteriales bacterium]HRJ40120.1 hypothetical protein [Flavobacteriales bacterium]
MKQILRLIQPNISSLGISLFLIVHVLEWIVGQTNFQFAIAPEWNEDIATWQNSRIASRFDLLFLCTLSSLIIVTGTSLLFNHLFALKGKNAFRLAILIGSWIFVLQLFAFFGNPQSSILPFTESIWVLCVLLAFFPHKTIRREDELLVLLAAGFSLAYGLNAIDDSQQLKLINTEGTFLIVLLIFFGVNRFTVLKSYGLPEMFRLFFPIILIAPVWTFSREIWHITNARGLFIKNPILLFPWIWMLSTLPFYLFKRSFLKSTSHIRNLIPYFLLASVVLPALYLDSYAYYCDPFELANPANAMMRGYEFGESSFSQFFSSHLLSEQIPGWIYYSLHGYEHGLGFMTYNMFGEMVYCFLFYIVLFTITGNRIHSLFITLLFPLTDTIFPISYSLLLFSVLIVLRLRQEFNIRLLLCTLTWSLFLIVWRLDLGIANAVAMFATTILIWIRKGVLQNMKIILITGGFLIVISIITFLLLSSTTKVNLGQALQYISANQAHALPDLALNYNHIFFFHYFLLPFIILIVALRSITKILRHKEIHIDFVLLFLCIAYFFNIQRGIVRHSLLEGNDTFITSFGFLILFIALLREYNWKTSFALSGITLLSIGFSFPMRNGEKNLLSKWDAAIEKENYPNGMKKISRVGFQNAPCITEINTLKAFIDHHFPASTTFIDLSNQPMLYYFLQRPVPSYFNQGLQNVMTFKMQRHYINELKNYDIPFVVYSSYPRKWFDDIDHIPNQLRYAIIREYVFDHYLPYEVIGGYFIWIRKDIIGRGPLHAANINAIPPEEWDLGLSPVYRYKEHLKTLNLIENAKIYLSGNFIDTVSFGNYNYFKRNEIYYLTGIINNKLSKNERISFRCTKKGTLTGTFNMTVPPGENYYSLPIYAQFQCRLNGFDTIIVQKLPEIELRIGVLKEKICDDCP